MTPRGLAKHRVLALVRRHPDGVLARTVAETVGLSTPTACAILARLFWAGAIDRRKDRVFTYTPREPVR